MDAYGSWEVLESLELVEELEVILLPLFLLVFSTESLEPVAVESAEPVKSEEETFFSYSSTQVSR